MRIAILLGAVLAAAPALAATPAGETVSKQIVDDFFTTGQNGMPRPERAVMFQAEDYIQHDPRLLKMDPITGKTGRDAWVAGWAEGTRRGLRMVDQGIPFRNPYILMAEGDLLHAVYRGRIMDPAHPGESYEAFAFETMRVKDGKFTEHWDGVRLAADWGTQRAAPAAQQPPATAKADREPRAPCVASAAEIRANKAAVDAYLKRPPQARAALRSADYVEHDPRGAGATDFKGERVVNIGECDLVSLVWKLNLPDPTAPGGRYDAFASDTYRLRGGKVSEHWSDAVRGRPAGE